MDGDFRRDSTDQTDWADYTRRTTLRVERPLPAHDVRGLMRGGTQAALLLDGMTYSLRITRAGKLILTK